MEERIRFYAAQPHQIDRRLTELEQEWDVERTLETNASSLALLAFCWVRSSISVSWHCRRW